MKKIALHVGIDKYDPAYYGNANLQKCWEDAWTMADLSSKSGFAQRGMLGDTQATKANIFYTLERYSKQLVAGDIFLYTHSGHGTYWDLPGGKRRTGVCAHDQIIWDYEMVPIWRKFAPGVIIVRIIDTCFSEDNFRFSPHRPADVRTRTLKAPAPPPVMKPAAARMTGVKARLVQLSSSSIMEVSYEDAEGGVFTQAVKGAVERLGLKTPSEIMRGAKLNIQSRHYPQTPQLQSSNGRALRDLEVF